MNREAEILFQQYGIAPLGALPSDRQLAHFRMGMKAFFHFGVNTFTDLEWGQGMEEEAIFDPSQCDCRQWLRVVKDAGMALAILTVKHHDGFCLWPSAYTEHSIRRSPYKNGAGDLVKEFTDACREYGIKAGIYISPWDRSSPLWGTAEYSIYFNNQLTELLTGYGPIEEVWWDGAGSTETPYDWKLWADTIRRCQPSACIFGALGAAPYVELRWIGNECGAAGDPCYASISTDALIREDTALLNSGIFAGERMVPAEVNTSIRPGWFYHESQDADVKSPAALVQLWFDSIGSGCMQLLNFPPDRRGLIPDRDAENARRAHEIISQTFRENLFAGAQVAVTGQGIPGLKPENVLADDDSFWAAGEDTLPVTLELKAKEPVTFDVFSASEVMPLGQRIDGYRVEAWVDGGWKTLAQKKAMGFRWADHFPEVTADRVRLVIFSAGAAPVIRHFGLYKLPQGALEEENGSGRRGNLVSNVEYQGSRAVVQFGGIYPFNTVEFDAAEPTPYTLEAFDGTSWHPLAHGEAGAPGHVVISVPEVAGSYQIRLTLKCPIREENHIAVSQI